MTDTRVHGGPDLDELGPLHLTADDLLDFSVNVNPYGAAPEMLAAIRGQRLDRYPDPRAHAARRALARAWEVAPEAIALGNGAAELLWTVAQRLVGPGQAMVVVAPTFCEPALAVQASGGEVISWRGSERAPPDLDAVANLARARAAAAVYLCNPQNPTGRLLPHDAVAAFARALEPTTLILDEAFLALSTGWLDARRALPTNVIRVRSLTKEHALPGLRVGAMIAPPAFVRAFEAVRPAWTVSAPAQAAAEVSARLEGFVSELRAHWLHDTAALAAALETIGRAPLPSDTVFLLVEVGDGAAVRDRLLRQHRILVRDCASFGLPRFIRVAGRAAADRARLVAALAV